MASSANGILSRLSGVAENVFTLPPQSLEDFPIEDLETLCAREVQRLLKTLADPSQADAEQIPVAAKNTQIALNLLNAKRDEEG